MTVLEYGLCCCICKCMLAGQIITEGKRDDFYTVYREYYFINGEHVCEACKLQLIKLKEPKRKQDEQIKILKENKI